MLLLSERHLAAAETAHQSTCALSPHYEFDLAQAHIMVAKPWLHVEQVYCVVAAVVTQIGECIAARLY